MERYAARFSTGNTVTAGRNTAGRQPNAGRVLIPGTARSHAGGKQIWVKARVKEVI